MREPAARTRFSVPKPYREWWQASGPAGLRHALAEAVGDASERWEKTRLPLFDPSFRVGPPLPPLATPAALYEKLHPDRRAGGVFYTPDAVVDWVIEQTDVGGVVLDPACGGGAFLRGVVRNCPPNERSSLLGRLRGQDRDPLAVMLTQALLLAEIGGGRAEAAALIEQIRVGDSLRDPWPSADCVLTNPPFLSRLRDLTALDTELAKSIRQAFGSSVGPYTDVSALFLLRARRHAAHVGIVLPSSVCATRDALGVRSEVQPPSAAWCLPKKSFSDVIVPMFAACWGGGSGVERWTDFPPRKLDLVTPTESAWGNMLATDDEPPALSLGGHGTFGDIATIDADFRDEYYHLAGRIREWSGDGDVRVYTSGLIGLGRSEWGERTARIHRSEWVRPAVERQHLHHRQAGRTGDLILVATQTRVLEACRAAPRTAIGLTPVLSVQAKAPDGKWPVEAIFALLLSPVATAWAVPLARGAGLKLDTLKLSAAQLRLLPLPASIDAETVALARGLTDMQAPELHREQLLKLAHATTAAYGADPSLVDWWARRAGISEQKP